MKDQLKYSFRRNKNSFDPYDSLTTKTEYPQNANHSLIEQNYSVWTNGATALLSTMQTTSNDANNPASPLLHSTNTLENDVGANTQHAETKTLSKNMNEVHEVRNSIVAGSTAGIISCMLFHPFDVIRTKMQTSVKLNAVGATSSPSTLLSTSSSPKNIISSSSGPLQVFSHTMKHGGLRSFYTGFSFPLGAQAAYKSTVFTVNRVMQNALVDYKTKEKQKTGIFTPYKMELVDHFTCGSISGCANALIFVSPVEYIRSQLIYQHTRIAEGKSLKNGPMNGPLGVIRSTLKSKGVTGLWRGAGITILRDSVGCGCFFASFDLSKRHLPQITGLEQNSQIVTIGSGMMAGLGYWAISLPLDALKTLVQSGKASSALNVCHLLVNRDGITSAVSQLYRGWQLAFGRGIPSAGVTLATYSAVYHYCNTHFS
jgi:hypothetical protein